MLWITSVQLPAFGRFRGAEFTLRPGMNLLYGKNEAGKSTILAAIAGTIFGFRKEKDRFVPWDGGERCEARVSFAYDGREMTIARDFLTDRVQAVERRGEELLWRFEGKVSAAGRSSEREEYLAKIEEVWGFAEGDIFRNSVYVGQRDLKIEGDGALTTRIKQLLSGFAEMDYDAVVESLEKELFELTRRPGGRSKDRELEEVRGRMAELAEAWRAASRTLEEVGKIEAELAELRGFIDGGQADLERGEKYLQRVKKYHETAVREAALRKEFDRVQAEREKVEALVAQQEAIEAQLAPLGDVTGLPDGFGKIIEAYCTASDRLDQMEEEMAGLDALPVAVRPVSVALLLSPLVCWGRRSRPGSSCRRLPMWLPELPWSQHWPWRSMPPDRAVLGMPKRRAAREGSTVSPPRSVGCGTRRLATKRRLLRTWVMSTRPAPGGFLGSWSVSRRSWTSMTR